MSPGPGAEPTGELCGIIEALALSEDEMQRFLPPNSQNSVVLEFDNLEVSDRPFGGSPSCKAHGTAAAAQDGMRKFLIPSVRSGWGVRGMSSQDSYVFYRPRASRKLLRVCLAGQMSSTEFLN